MRHRHNRMELCLQLSGVGEPPPPPRRPPDPSVDCWRDTHGDVCAYAYEHSGQFFMDWPGVARFCFDTSGHTVRAWPSEGAVLDSVRRVHRRAVVPAALQQLGAETLHASAARLSGGVIGFCGHAGAGKSTMAVACAAASAEQWADDTLVLDIEPSSVTAIAIDYDVALRRASVAHFGDRAAAEGVMRASRACAPLTALCLIDRAATVPALRQLGAVDALHGLLPHACTFSMTDSARRRLMIEHYLALVDVVPIYHLSYPSNFDVLPEVVELVRRELDTPATVSRS